MTLLIVRSSDGVIDATVDDQEPLYPAILALLDERGEINRRRSGKLIIHSDVVKGIYRIDWEGRERVWRKV